MTGGAAVAGDRWAPLEGAELYSAATTHEQAAISWRAAAKIAKRSPEIRARLDVPAKIAKTSRFNIAYHDASAFFRALAADSDTLDGLNPYLAIVDELHAHKDGTLLDVLESGMGSRLEPLLLMITTAGADADGVCGDVERDAIKILRRDYSDDSVGDDIFVLICRIDEDDDRFNPAVWPKSNPNLGVSVTLEGIQAQAAAASREPRKLNEFLRKQLNLWTAGVDAWLPAGRWEASSTAPDGSLREVDLEALRGKQCYVGVDLGSTNDTTSVSAVWPLDDGEFATWLWTFVPEETIADHSIRGPRERELLQQWVRAGLVTATPGDMVDYDAVWQQILNIHDRYGIAEAAFDRWSASSLFGRCEQVGITAVPFGQGYASMSPAMKFAETIIGHRKLIHGGHPVLRWMVSNTAAKCDPAGNIKADKSQRTRRIDGTVAMLMGLGRAMVAPEISGDSFVHVLDDDDDEEATA
jgi:phage terminase large subunit-like protein